MACEATPNKSQYKFTHTGSNMPENTTFVSRVKMNSDDLQLELVTSNDEGLLLKKELVTSVLEYAANKMIMHISPSDLLLTNNW